MSLTKAWKTQEYKNALVHSGDMCTVNNSLIYSYISHKNEP